ncbi:MAG: hypothetical protein CM1200mP35_05820 [Chloroflexota bacterium]|nr:MAG: hypothetical protein CM1200mP35_05820 [Chloroflexota bacterium]
MVPRLDMVPIKITAVLRSRKIFLESGHSRLPVYEDTIDHVTGVIHARDILQRWQIMIVNLFWANFIRPAFFIPESKRLDGLLKRCKRNLFNLR